MCIPIILPYPFYCPVVKKYLTWFTILSDSRACNIPVKKAKRTNRWTNISNLDFSKENSTWAYVRFGYSDSSVPENKNSGKRKGKCFKSPDGCGLSTVWLHANQKTNLGPVWSGTESSLPEPHCRAHKKCSPFWGLGFECRRKRECRTCASY